MQNYTENTYTEIDLADLVGEVTLLKEQGYRFIQLCATTQEKGAELLYSFLPESFDDPAIKALVVQQQDGQSVDSISEIYPESFVFENETHDLFGIDFDGLVLDYGGEFYTTSVAYPMNERAANFKKDTDKEKADGGTSAKNSADKEGAGENAKTKDSGGSDGSGSKTGAKTKANAKENASDDAQEGKE